MFLSKKDETYCDFTVTKVTLLQELNCVLKELVHVPSGAQIMHIGNDDPENLFCLSFQTLPTDSKGVAHILEHTVLCGSKKFPVKDPFFSMTRRSLNTFMNALTGSDFTCYPAASQVEPDFYHLLEVYLDAVFHPQLKKESFLQEGHRLEFADLSLKKLVFKGIVFNEMKGALHSPDSRLWHEIMMHLVPKTTYAYISGGDPKEIPSLSYEELKKFHQVHYHPSRALFFFYGNLPLKKHLDFILEKELKDVSEKMKPYSLKKQKRFSKPVYKEGFYPLSSHEKFSQKQDIIALGWLTSTVEDQETVLALNVLDAILMETDASSLKYPLLKSGFCVSSDAYIDTEMPDIPYVIVCKGCDHKEADALERLIFDTLAKIVRKGIDFKEIASAVHQIEFTRTEITGEHTPFGLTLFMRSALAKQHGCPPENALLIHSLFENFLKKAQDPTYLPGLIEKFLLKNRHFVRVVMRPDPLLTAKEEKKEEEKLQKILNSLSEKEKEEIQKQAQALAVYQKEVEIQSLDCLPKIELKDVPVLTKDFVLKHKERVLHHTCFTNHIVYADLIFDLPPIETQDLPYVQLISLMLSEVGAGEFGYVHQLEELQAYTGGMGSALSLHVQATDSAHMRPCWIIRGKSLVKNVSPLFQLMKRIATSFRLDEKERIEELMLQIHSTLESKLNKNALRYAIQLALSGFSFPGKIGNLWTGFGFFKKVQEIVSHFSSRGLSDFIEKLTSVREKIFMGGTPQLILSCDEEALHLLEKEGYFGILDLPQRNSSLWREDKNVTPLFSQGRVLASPLFCTALAYKVCSYIHPNAPALNIASHLMDNKFLHREIREQGGAYGAGSTYASMTGYFTLHSYRDPHLASTVQSFEQAIERIAQGSFNAQDLEEAKLGMIQQLDVPVAPGNRASNAYTWQREGKTKEMRQKYRDKMLSVSSQDVQKAVQKELLSQVKEGILVSFGGKEILEKESKILSYLQKPLPIIPI